MRIRTVIAAGLTFLSAAAARADDSIKLTLDGPPGRRIPDGFLGVSIETAAMMPEADGPCRYNPGDKPLIRMFETIGIKSLRVGGNTVDVASYKIPGKAEIDPFFGFAHAAGVKVIYTMRLKPPIDIATEAETAKYIFDHYSADLDTFQLGNEPNLFGGKSASPHPTGEMRWDAYKTPWLEQADAISKLLPGAKFCGPSTAGGDGSWQRNMAAEPQFAGKVSLITVHEYFGGNGLKVRSPRQEKALAKDEITPAAGRDKLLDPAIEKRYQKLYDSFGPAVAKAGLPYRVEETNSFYNAGAEGASNSVASALWGLEYLHWWADHDAVGLNFHTGDSTAAGGALRRSWYALFWKAGDGFNAHPLAYGCKAFDLGSHGKRVAVKLDGADENLHAHAVVTDDGKLVITLINMAHAPDSPVLTVTLPSAYSAGEFYALTVPDGDIAATTGVTLGGAEITDDGTWAGKSTPIIVDNALLSVKVPKASAVVVILKGG
jgi:hypothetical protein